MEFMRDHDENTQMKFFAKNNRHAVLGTIRSEFHVLQKKRRKTYR